MWLGGLLNPEAYITATRQCIAQANSWSLEELILDVTITDQLEYDSVQQDECSFGVIGKFILKTKLFFLNSLIYPFLVVKGLKLQGAQCRNNQLLLTSSIMTDLPVTLLRWTQ